MCTIGTVLTVSFSLPLPRRDSILMIINLYQNSRIYWSLARDNAVPISSLFGKVNESLSCPVYATLLCGMCPISLLHSL